MKNVAIKLLTIATLLGASAAHATTLVLPTANALATGEYNGFTVYSLDLLKKCAEAGDARCLPSGPFPVSSSPGNIADQAVVLASNGGASNFPDPFANATRVDDVFMSPTGNQSNTYTMVDAGGGFIGDLANRWDIKISALSAYLGTSDLVFLFDNNQSSSGATQYLNLWGQARIVDSTGKTLNNMCYELSTGTGCDFLNSEPDPSADKYVPVISDFCVDRVTGASYSIGTAKNAGDCPVNAEHPKGGYQVNNNISTSSAEFAAFNQTLNDFVKNAANSEYFLSLNIKYSGNNAGAEQLWICSDCNIGSTDVPEPGSLALLGLGLFGASVVRRKKRV